MERETKNCQNCKQDFNIEPDDFSFYEKMKVPAPTFCPLCRAQRRFCWRNEWVLYKGPSDYSKKDIFKMYAPDAGVKVYEKEVWITDEWDPLSYGVDYDFTKPFFKQWRGLLAVVPLKNLDVLNGINSDYTNNLTDPKNAYLVFNGSHPEDCMYSNGVNYCRDCVDISHTSQSEKCYEGFWLNSCTNCYFCSQCDSSFNLWFSKNCVGCNDCFGCVGLRKKSYCIWNEQYTKEEYFKKLESFKLSSYKNLNSMKKEAGDFWLKFPCKYIEGLKNEKVSGAYIDRSYNVKNSLLVRESKDMRYCQYVQELPGSKDCYDYSVWGDSNEKVYECHTSGIGMYNVKFSVFAKEMIRDVEYCYACTACSDCFGCVSLRKKQYCIFNKQYSKEEYFELLTKIKNHMNEMPYVDANGCVYKYGEFFPSELSPFPYNQTLAQEYFPLNKDEAQKRGYWWADSEDKNYKTTISASELPDDIGEVSDSILNEIIECDHKASCTHLCPKAFKITKDELEFYRKIKIPIPRLCFYCRSFERLKQRNGINLYERSCQCAGEKDETGVYSNLSIHQHHKEGKCLNKFETAYNPNNPTIIYCEECYQQEVI